MKIRIMEHSDIGKVVELCKKMRAEVSGFNGYTISEEKVFQLGEQIVADPETKCCVVADNDGVIAGFFAGAIGEVYFGYGKTAYDIAFYMDKEYRSTLMAQLLVVRFEQWAQEHGAKDILLGVTTEHDTEKVVAFYNSLGYQTCGTFVKKKVEV